MKHSKLLSTIKPTTKKRTTLKHSSSSFLSPQQIAVKSEKKLKDFIRVEEIDPCEGSIEEAPLSISNLEKRSKTKVHKPETNKISQDTHSLLKTNESFNQKIKVHKKNVHRSKGINVLKKLYLFLILYLY